MNRIKEYYEYENWKNFIDDTLITYKDRILVKYMKKRDLISVSGEELHEEVKKYASVFAREGLQRKHVGLYSGNCYELTVSYLGLFYSGTVDVLISKDMSAAELKEYAQRTDLSAIIVNKETVEKALEAKLGIPIYYLGDEEIAGTRSMKEESAKGIIEIVNDTKKDDLMYILMTSGTTGRCKAVMHTNAGTISGICTDFFYEDIKSSLCVFPFHHVIGFGITINTLMRGGTSCIGESPVKMFRYLKSMKPEFTYVVPSMMKIVCQKLGDKLPEEIGWNLKFLGCGGARVPETLSKILLDKGIVVLQSYGATETLGRGTIDRVSLSKPGMLGKPDIMIEARVEDEELVIKGPMISTGYYGDPEETKKAFVDGWYYTGDLARLDEDGDVFLMGRKKNLIILSNGENISPEEIEQDLLQNDLLQEILVRENDDHIEAVIFPAYTEDMTDDEKDVLKKQIEEVVEAYNGTVPTYKRVFQVTFTDTPLPKTSSNKIKRF